MENVVNDEDISQRDNPLEVTSTETDLIPIRSNEEKDEPDGTSAQPKWKRKLEDALEPSKDEEEAIQDNCPILSSPSTSQENLADSPEVTKSQSSRVLCKYGSSCYRRNPIHKEEYSHLGDDDYEALMIKQKATAVEETASLDDRPECEYGTSCYRQNPQHKKDFKHTQSPQLPASPGPTTKRPAKRRRVDADDESNSSENEYDLEDSFIASEDEEGSEDDEEDEDYQPEAKQTVDPELLNEEQWKPSSDDAPEVLELLKEARDYLRNKKLQK